MFQEEEEVEEGKEGDKQQLEAVRRRLMSSRSELQLNVRLRRQRERLIH